MLYNWDAVQFALALREYDVVKHQPHPPGYILYVALGRIVNAWLGDPVASYVALAVVMSGATTFVVYYLARTIYDRATALTATTLLAVSPLFWFYGSVGLSYASEALFASVVAYYAFRALEGSRTDGWLAAGYLGLAGGVRQSLLVLLLPLWLGSVVLGMRRARALLAGLAILAGCVVTWFVPMVWLTGGLARYLAASAQLADSVVMPTSIVGGPIEITVRMSRHLVESVLVGLGPLAAVALLVPWYVRRFGWSRREAFLLGWTLPPVLVYTLVHFGQGGYALTFLPALTILLARVLVAALGCAAERASHVRARSLLTTAVVTLVVLVNGAFFVSARPMVRDFDTPQASWVRHEAFDWIWSRTAAALREHEAVVRTYVETIRGMYPAEDTALITEQGNPRSYPWFRHAMFYLSDYPAYELQIDRAHRGYRASRLSASMIQFVETRIAFPSSTRRLVWFVDHWSPTVPRPQGLLEIEIPYGRYLYVLPLGRRPVAYGDYTLVRERPSGRAAPRPASRARRAAREASGAAAR